MLPLTEEPRLHVACSNGRDCSKLRLALACWRVMASACNVPLSVEKMRRVSERFDPGSALHEAMQKSVAVCCCARFGCVSVLSCKPFGPTARCMPKRPASLHDAMIVGALGVARKVSMAAFFEASCSIDKITSKPFRHGHARCKNQGVKQPEKLYSNLTISA